MNGRAIKLFFALAKQGCRLWGSLTGTDWPLFLVEQLLRRPGCQEYGLVLYHVEPQDAPAGPGKRWLLLPARIFSFMSAK